MPYWVNPNLTGVSAAAQIAAAQNAANTWNTQGNANFKFAYQGQTNETAVAENNIFIIAGRTDCVPLGTPPQCTCVQNPDGTKTAAFAQSFFGSG